MVIKGGPQMIIIIIWGLFFGQNGYIYHKQIKIMEVYIQYGKISWK